MVCALAVPVSLFAISIRSGYNCFSDTLPGDTRAGACGGPLKRDALSIPSDDLSGKVYDCWNLRGPPLGEAPARSSLVPRDLTAELCLMPLASLGILLLGIRLAAFFISRC